MLRCENIHFSYDKSKKFIENLNIDIPKSEITTILGLMEVGNLHYLLC